MVYRITLEAARVNVKMTQKEVAKVMDVNVGTISNWETGKTFPDLSQFMKLCEIYRCPQDVIFLPNKFI